MSNKREERRMVINDKKINNNNYWLDIMEFNNGLYDSKYAIGGLK